jgi:broad specificity phosphatase PhoE
MLGRRVGLLTIALAAAAGLPGHAATAPDTAATTVIVVRHAEKMPHAPGSDAGLSPAGVRRGDALRRTLTDAHVAAIYSSPFGRARQTGLALAAQLHDSVRVMGADDFQGIVERVRRENRGQTVLVIGHSDTVPKILEAFCGRALPDLSDIDYDRMYVVVLAPGRPATLLKLRYGEVPEPAK